MARKPSAKIRNGLMAIISDPTSLNTFIMGEAEFETPEAEFHDPAPGNSMSIGFTPVTEEGYFFQELGSIRIANVRIGKKALSSSAVSSETEKKVQAIESTENRRIYRKEKDAIKAEVLYRLMQQAPVVYSNVPVLLLNLENKTVLFLGTSSHSTFDLVAKHIRNVCGSLPLMPIWNLIQTKMDTSMFLTQLAHHPMEITADIQVTGRMWVSVHDAEVSKMEIRNQIDPSQSDIFHQLQDVGHIVVDKAQFAFSDFRVTIDSSFALTGIGYAQMDMEDPNTEYYLLHQELVQMFRTIKNNVAILEKLPVKQVASA